jgi:Mce-associated membrane protein
MADDVDSAGDLMLVLDDDGIDVEDDGAESSADGADGIVNPPVKKPMAAVTRAMLLGSAIAVALAVLVGWLGFRAYQSEKVHAQRTQYLEVARQGAVNLTTIDWQHADADVQRILDGATGRFYDDFSTRAQPFVEMVKNAKSTTVGTVKEAGLESESADTAQALVAVTVTNSNAGTAEPDPREWRLRVVVQKVGDQAKVSNVEFVS